MTLPDHVAFWSAVSLPGSPLTMTVLCVALAGTLAARGRRIPAVAVLLVQGGGGLLNMTLKELVKRPRPPGSELVLNGFSWSFPSGHAMGSLIGYGMLYMCIDRYWTVSGVARRTLLTAFVSTVLAIGISRIALGVHYPGDVVGGFLIGASWLSAGLMVLRRVEAAQLSPSVAPAQ
jgi:undecaprenyl-diphosphatase